MEIAVVPQVVVNGIVSGLTYALIAVAFNLIYGVGKVFYFAVSGTFMVGGVLVYLYTVQLGIPYVASVLLALVTTAVLGLIVEMALVRRIRRMALAVGILSLGINLILVNVVMLTFGEQPKAIQSPAQGVIRLFGAVLSAEKIVVVVASLVVVALAYYFVNRTRTGRSMQAVAQGAEAAVLAGVDPLRVSSLTFMLASALAGFAGAVVVPLTMVDPFAGDPALLKTLSVAVIGGLGSFPGAVVGGLLLGLVESFGLTFIGGIANILGFLLVIALLVVRPMGFFGRWTEVD